MAESYATVEVSQPTLDDGQIEACSVSWRRMRLSRITQAADGIVGAGIAIVTASGQWLYLAQSGRGNQSDMVRWRKHGPVSWDSAFADRYEEWPACPWPWNLNVDNVDRAPDATSHADHPDPYRHRRRRQAQAGGPYRRVGERQQGPRSEGGDPFGSTTEQPTILHKYPSRPCARRRTSAAPGVS